MNPRIKRMGWFGTVGLGVVSVVGITGASRSAHAQDIDIPVLVLDSFETEPEAADIVDETMIVRSVAKRVVSVQESARHRHGRHARADPRSVAIGRSPISCATSPASRSMRPGTFLRNNFGQARGTARALLVLWNGNILNTVESNTRPLDYNIPLAFAERVEVLSGPGGVMWGANAVLGIVNVTTRRGDSGTPVEVDVARRRRPGHAGHGAHDRPGVRDLPRTARRRPGSA